MTLTQFRSLCGRAALRRLGPVFKPGWLDVLPCCMSRHELTDAAWRRLASLLPPQRALVGRPARDHRTMVNAMLWLTRTGAPWRDLPERYGPWQTVATRFYRWTRSGLWQRLLGELQRDGDAAGRLDWSVHMVDGTSIRAHRHAAGAKGGRKTRRSAARGAASAASSICAASGRQADRLRPDRRRAPRADCVPAPDGGGRGQARRPWPATPPAASAARRSRLHRPAGPRASAAPRHHRHHPAARDRDPVTA